MGRYEAPSVLRRWTLDVPGGDLHELTVLDNGCVCMASGRFAHSSSACTCTWVEFIGGTMNALAADKLGKGVLTEALAYISNEMCD